MNVSCSQKTLGERRYEGFRMEAEAFFASPDRYPLWITLSQKERDSWESLAAKEEQKVSDTVKPETGFAVTQNNVIVVTSVSPTARGAMVNWLWTNQNVSVTDAWTSKQIALKFKELKDAAKARLINVSIAEINSRRTNMPDRVLLDPAPEFVQGSTEGVDYSIPSVKALKIRLPKMSSPQLHVDFNTLILKDAK